MNKRNEGSEVPLGDLLHFEKGRLRRTWVRTRWKLRLFIGSQVEALVVL